MFFFLEFSCFFFFMIQWMLTIWSLVPLPFLKPDRTSGSSWLTYSWSLACPLNYGKQEEKEAPGKFLDRLREDLLRSTEIDPESQEGQAILKYWFLTQSVPDICLKLLKHVYGPNQSLHSLLQLAQTVYYGRENEEMKERQKRTREQVETSQWLWKQFLNSLRKMHRGT